MTIHFSPGGGGSSVVSLHPGMLKPRKTLPQYDRREHKLLHSPTSIEMECVPGSHLKLL